MTAVMNQGRRIRALGAGDLGPESEPSSIDDARAVEGAPESIEAPSEYELVEDQPATLRRLWPSLLAGLAAVAVLAWTGFFIWTHQGAMLARAPLNQWIEWIAQWSVPVLLMAVAWLIAMRSSAREAARFGDAARLLAQESAHLEMRLTAVNRELSLAREFLAAQSRELEYLGRSAAERIAEHAGTLQALVVDNSAQVEAIASVSQTALANMAELRDNLPVIANSARDVTNQIGGAGRTAKAQLGELVAGFERLNEFGQASERQVASLRERIDTALEDLGALVDSMDANNAARIEAIRSDCETLRQELDARESEVLAAMRERGETLRSELVAAHDARQLEEAAALAAMRGRIAAFTREAHDAAAAVRAGERAALEAWDGQVTALRERLETALAEVATLDQQLLDKAREKLEVLANEAEAVDERLTERDRAFQERVTQRQAAFEDYETSALARLAERTEAFDSALAARHEAQLAQARQVGEHGEALAARLGEIEAHVAALVARSAEAEQTLAQSSSHFAATVSANSQELSDTERALARLTDSSVRLLELIQAAASHARSELPTAVAGFEGQLEAARANTDAIRSTLDEAQRVTADVRASLEAVHGASETAVGDLDAYRARLTGTAEEQAAALAALRAQFAEANEESQMLTAAIKGDLGQALAELAQGGREALMALNKEQNEAIEAMRIRLAEVGTDHGQAAEKAASILLDAIAQLKQRSAEVLEDLEAQHSQRVTAIVTRIGEEGAQAIDRALQARTEETVARLDEATARAAQASQDAVANLRDQLARVHELTVNLETRAEQARAQVEEQVDNDFSRRMALITESLNSHSIDIAKALSTEVTDTAWASYLKGDRGVFTRRAVRLVDGGDAREIAALYESDHEFREHVSRYIHDFEAMLRTMLSTRDGHALGVTLLSSDMGKLYVALAQAIQRLRQ
jgi:hypothetical protein